MNELLYLNLTANAPLSHGQTFGEIQRQKDIALWISMSITQ